MTLPESLSNGMTMLEGKSTFLQVDISQSATKEQESKALSLGSGLSPTPAASPTRAFPPKVEDQISMTMEVSELLSWAVLDISGPASRSSTPKRPGSLVLATPLPLKLEDSAKLVDTSSQVSTPEDAEMDDPTLEEIHASLPPGEISRAQWGSSLHKWGLTPKGGQQGPVLLVGNQVFP